MVDERGEPLRPSGPRLTPRCWLLAVVGAVGAAPAVALAHGPGVSVGIGIVIPIGPRPAPAPYALAPGAGYLRTEVDPPTAQVFVDGYPVGRADELAAPGLARLAAGRHRLEIVAPGLAPHVAALVIEPGQTTEVRVRLVPAPPARPTPEPFPVRER